MIKYITTYELTCDYCKKEYTRDFSMADMTMPSMDVPVDWIRMIPPGQSGYHEFCSMDCFSNFMKENPIGA